MLFCVITAGMWVRSHWTRDMITAYPSTTSHLDSESGELAIGLETYAFRTFRLNDCEYVHAPIGVISPSLKPSMFLWIEMGGDTSDTNAMLSTFRNYRDNAPRIAIRSSKRNPGGSVIGIRLAYWAIVVSTAVLPALVGFQRVQRYRRGHAGRCLNCGYDLRATPDRCPECGRTTPQKTAAGTPPPDANAPDKVSR